MGLYDRDFMRKPAAGRRSSVSPALLFLLAGLLVVAVMTGTLDRGVGWFRSQHRSPAVAGVGVSLAPGVTLRTAGVPRHDPWASFLAPESECPGRSDSSTSTAVEQAAAICLLNYARQKQGLAALPESPEVSAWSAAKAADIARCNDFSHEPCGEHGDIHAREAGFRGAFGENIYLGPQVYKTPLAAVDGWLNSPDHRENLFRPQWRAQGIAVYHVDLFRGQDDVAIWVSEFTDS